MSKITFAVIFLIISSPIFACKVSSKMAESKLFLNGLSNKLLEVEKYKNFIILKTSYKSSPNYYDVLIQDTSSNKCLSLYMQSFGQGSCDFTAEIIKEKESNCNE